MLILTRSCVLSRVSGVLWRVDFVDVLAKGVSLDAVTALFYFTCILDALSPSIQRLDPPSAIFVSVSLISTKRKLTSGTPHTHPSTSLSTDIDTEIRKGRHHLRLCQHTHQDHRGWRWPRRQRQELQALCAQDCRPCPTAARSSSRRARSQAEPRRPRGGCSSAKSMG